MQQQQRNILHQVPVTIKAAGVYDLCGVTCSREELSLALRRHHQPFLLGVKNGASPQNFLSTKTRRGADVGSPLLSAVQGACVCVWDRRRRSTMRSEQRVRRCGSAAR